MKKIKIVYILLGAFLFSYGSLNAQINIQVNVTEVTTNIGDCDNSFFQPGDSDPAWWWFDGGSSGLDIDDQCFGTSANGGTFPLNLNLWDEDYACVPDIPNPFTFQFRACEDDGPTGCVLGSAGGISCDGAFGDLTVDLGALPSTSGTTTVGPFCINSNCGSGGTEYCFSAEIVVTGTLPPAVEDNICDALMVTVDNVPNQYGWCMDQTTEANETIAPTVLGSENGSAWFSFTAPASGNVTLDTYTNTFLDGDNCSFLGCGTEFSIYHAANGTDCTGNNHCTDAQIKDKFDYLSWIDNADLGGPANATFYADLSLGCGFLGSDGLVPGEVYYVQVSTDDPGTTGILGLDITDDGGGPNTTHDIPCQAFGIDGILSTTPVTNDGSVPGTIAGETGTCFLVGHSSQIANVTLDCTHDWETDEDNQGGAPPYAYDESLGGDNDPDGSVWVEFTAPNSGQLFFEANICLQGEAIALYSPDVAFGPGTPVDFTCADLKINDYTTDVNAGSTFGGATAILQPNCLEPGYSYYFMIDPTTASVADPAIWAFDPVTAGLSPNLDAAPLNDIMCFALSNAAYEVPVNAVGSCALANAPGDNTNACIETLAGEPQIGGGQTTWHYFTVPASGAVEINLEAGSIGFANFAVYETADGTTAGCYGGTAAGGGSTFTDTGTCSLTPCITGSTVTSATKCCLNPGDVLAIQVDGAGVTGGYTIEINEVDIDAGMVSYIDPDGTTVDNATTAPAAAGPAIFCVNETLAPASDAAVCPVAPYCSATCDYPVCMAKGFVVHDQVSPTTGPVNFTVYASDNPGGMTGFTNDGTGVTIPTCQIVYVSSLVDGNDVDDTWGNICPSAVVSPPAPMVFLNAITVSVAPTVDGDCNVSFTLDGGLRCFDGASEYTYDVQPSGGGASILSGTSNAGVVAFTAPSNAMYDVVVTDGEGCPTTVMVDASVCTAILPCNIPNGTWSK